MRRGVSFIELLICIVLLAISFVPLLSILLAGHTGTQFSVSQQRAFAMASDAAEAIGTLDYDQVTQPAIDALMQSLPAPHDPAFVLRVTVFEPEKTVPIAGAHGKLLHYKPISVLVTFPRRGEAGGSETAQVTLGFVRSRMEDPAP